MQSWTYVVKNRNDVLYVGSTSNLQARVGAHKSLVHHSSRPLYACIRGLGGWEAIEFRVLEMNTDLTPRDLRRKEQEAIDRLRPIFNKNRAYSSLSGTPYHREYRASRGLHHFRDYNRQYHISNRDRINAQRRMRRAQARRDAAEIEEAALVLQTLQGSS